MNRQTYSYLYRNFLVIILMMMPITPRIFSQQVTVSSSIQLYGQPVEDSILVSCLNVNDTNISFSAYTSPGGDFSIPCDTGDYIIRFSYPGYFPIQYDSVALYSDRTVKDTILFPVLDSISTNTFGPGVHVVTRTLKVSEHDTLKILPGTTFRFLYNTGLTIEGTVYCTGNINNFISFTSFSNEGWNGIHVTNNAPSPFFQYIDISNASDSTFYVQSDSIYIFNALIHDMNSSSNGGGIYLEDAFASINHTTFFSNNAFEGGAIYSNNSTLNIDSCSFRSNNSTNSGGAIYSLNGSLNICNSKFIENSSDNGGALSVYDCTTDIHNSIFKANIGNSGGAIKIYFGNKPHLISHCNFLYNLSTTGSAMLIHNNNLQVHNTDFSYNGDTGSYVLYNNTALEFNVTHCNFYNPAHNFYNCPGLDGQTTQQNANGTPCDNYFNIYENPNYHSLDSGDYHLNYTSSLIDAADTSSTRYATDILGNKRLKDGDLDGSVISDIGAYEFQIDPLKVEAVIQHPATNNSNDGSIMLSVSGGMPPYSVLWQTGDTDDTLTGLSAGTYHVAIHNLVGNAFLDTFEINALAHDTTCSIHGTVKDNQGNIIESEVIAYLNDAGTFYFLKKTRVLHDGTFNIENITPGEYILKASPTGSAKETHSSSFYPEGNNMDAASRLYIQGLAYGIDMKLPDNRESKQKNVSPNPASHYIELDITESEFKNAQIQMVNTLGQKMHFSPVPRGNNTRFDIQSLENGVYFIQFIKDARIETISFIKR